jgi:endoglucanase
MRSIHARLVSVSSARFASVFVFLFGLAALPAAGCVAPAPPPAGNVAEAAAAEPPPPPKKVEAPAVPVVPRKKGENVFIGATWFQDPYGFAHLAARRLKQTDPEGSALIEKIAVNGGADWIGDWTPNVGNWVLRRVQKITKDKAFPLFVVYNVPKRDCGQYSAGGADKSQAYKDWITAFAHAIGEQRAAVILEPDSLGLLKKCLSEADQKERLELLRFAVHAFEDQKNTAVYLDAGNAGWIPAPEMAERLKGAGIEEADGFALNVSNYKTTAASIKYGHEISKRLGDKHFVIDTSRNGNGPPDVKGDVEAAWCNPPGRALGTRPTTETGDPLVDAFLWLKKPGESDGECNGGPKAGVWWNERALELSKNAKY